MAITQENHPHYKDPDYAEEFYLDYTKEVKDFFTLRTMWWGYHEWGGKRFVGTEDNWSFGYSMADEKVKSLSPEELLSTHKGKREQAAVTAAQHPVTMTHVTFQHNMAEDAVNFVHSKFAMRNVSIVDARSDGVDADFADGTIAQSSFQHIGWGGGGDAVDISGARVTIDSSSFSDIGDKALSAGEGSTMDVRSVTIDGAGAGVVSKDRSILMLSGAHLTAIRHAGLMAYIKKPEYGVAQMDAINVTQDGDTRRTWVQNGSSILLDGVAAPTEAVNVDSLYETVMRKGQQ